MKKKLILFILLILLLPISVFAEDAEEPYVDKYKYINFSAVFVTQADVSSIDRIVVNYTTILDGVGKDEQVILLKDNNFIASVAVGSMNDVRFNYAYCMTYDNLVDKFGFLPITAEKRYNDEELTIKFILSVDFNNMNYNGRNYITNSDLSKEDIQKRKQGSVEFNVENEIPTTTTTTKPEEIVIGRSEEVTSTSTVLTEVTEKTSTKEEEKNEELNKLYIIAGIIGSVIFIFVIITVIKVSQANKMM